MQQLRFFASTLALIVLAGSVGLCVSCSSSDRRVALPTPVAVKAMKPVPMPTFEDSKPKDFPGIHNAVTYHEGFISGSVPEGDAGFDTLAAMGVKTIISVDGAKPEVGEATSRGMNYIHLPIGYNGFNEERKLQLVRATRDSIKDGPVYIHCHHGKHRSAGAAATVAESLGWITPDQGVARMKVSGTAANYTGLYACAANAKVLDTNIIDAVPANFPSISKPSGYVQAMVEIDEVNEHLKAIEKAGWITPSDHPDLVPVAEAGRLADLYRSAHATPYTKRKPADFAEMMTKAQTEAQLLESLLAAGKVEPVKASDQYKLIVASCKSCHIKYRD